MSRRLLNPLPATAISAQRSAADPRASVWVEANAGSGKTHVLTQRVLRLLLSNVRPEEVLCLTYTKAAAAEMRKRVSAQLGQWALLPEPDLRKALTELIGAAPSAAEQTRARSLFAHALDTPGGLKILTIHAFCESVLHRFPVEAGVPFDFSVLEDFERQSMILRAREKVLAAGLRGGEHAEAVETLFGHLSDFSIREAIEDALAKARPLRQVLADREGAKRRLRDRVGHAGELSSAAIRHAIEHESLLRPDDCRELVRILGGDPHKTRGVRFADVLARANLDRPSCDDLMEAFLTGEGTGRTSLMSAKDRAMHGELHARFEAERDRIAALNAVLQRTRLIERSEALLDILSAIVEDYEAAKRARSLLDFDDLVERAAALFRDVGQGAWVRYKLDAGITHILVDESQDTNAEQWAVVTLLSDDFFDGESAVQRPRTVFSVGDGKQSIFSFQGARPELFGETGDRFAAKATAVEARFARLPLRTSFRSLPNILAAVDAVFAPPEKHAAVLAREPILHETARAEGGGIVTLWPPVQASSVGSDDADGGWPLEPPDTMASAPRQVAMRIAREIRGWIDSRRPVGPRGRPVRPDDILILVQMRAALFHELIRALIAHGVPTPGADRLMVTTHIAILDLMALGDVLLNPMDELQLAALLRSPLFDIDEAGLHALAQPRKGSLWSALGDAASPAARAAGERLRAWRSRLDFERPYEFFASVLYAEGGLRAFHARFGSEVDDLFAEFLDLALEHEQSENPSLQGFLASMRAREVTITRELSGSSAGVRVMTVHGAKGLEAPIVILADAAGKPQGRQLAKPVLIDAAEGLFIHASGRKDHHPATLPLRQKEEDAQWAEYWRKLYVAMTRAEDELYVTGALTPSRTAESQIAGTWYEAIEQALTPHSELERDAAGEPVAIVYPRERTSPPAGKDTSVPIAPAGTPDLPPLPAHRRVEVVRPSLAHEPAPLERIYETAADGVRDAETARRAGIALHALLQHLAPVASTARRATAAAALAVLAPDLPGLADKAIAILGRPDLADLFGPHSRAEVPFLARGTRRGHEIRLAGRIDRIVVTDREVTLVDFKSDAVPPPNPAGVPHGYLTQLGLYALVARQLFPGHAVRAAILWTSLESLMILPAAALREATDGFTLERAS